MVELACPKSEALFERAKKILPGGVSRNTLLRGKHPLYAARGFGSRVVDVDGVERIDFANNMASHIHGHAFAPIVKAVTEQLQLSTAFTMATECEIRFAEHLCARAPGFEKIRFVNSGTEAVMAGIKAARAYTGRSKIAKVEGSYHGAYDYAEISQGSAPGNWGSAEHPNAVPLARGTPAGVVDDVIVIPFNDPEKSIRILGENRGEIACVIVDPIPHRIGMVPVSAAMVEALYKWTRADGALLMFDEVITFRNEFGGMQSRYGIQPDLTSMGKLIGGGFPVGALAGSDEVMSVFARGEHGLRLPHSGTFSANPVTMTAGLVAMEMFDKDSISKLNTLGDYTRAGLSEVIKLADVPACVTGTGSLLRVHLKPHAPRNYREAYPLPGEQKVLNSLIDALYDQKIMMIHTGSAALSTPMDIAEIDVLCEAMHNCLLALKGQIEAINN